MTYLKEIALASLVSLALPSMVQAECFADYKAKQTGGDLKLHYGVIAVPDKLCGQSERVTAYIEKRIGSHGWQLLRVMSSFDENGLDARAEDAGEYFLRY